ncbi:MAG: 3-dehydroquinate synthase [Clostridia bacterium]|nr:3-dehydroquinate synthase [Clostridia bacterium]
MEKLTLNAPSAKGEIYIGKGAVQKYLRDLTVGQKNFVLTDDNVYALYKDFFAEYFSDAEVFVMPAGEENKNFITLQRGAEKMIAAGLRRTSRLFAVGGGVVGDVGGLLAALYMRGINYVQVPTTLLAQVDSSVGGKTAIDFVGVKNVLGAFYQPQTVLVDPMFLGTLPKREWKCGVGEIVKYAALSEDIFAKLYAGKDKLFHTEFLASLTADCIRHKAGVVERDERELGERKSLNVGHTTGHAIELFYGLSHGESVLYGMKAETVVAINRGVCEKEYGEKLLSIVESALLLAPQSSPDFTRFCAAALLAKSDKKNGEDGKIVMSVAKTAGEWNLLALPEKEYVTEITEALL